MIEPLESGSWTQLFAAVATLLAIIVALFKERIIAWRYPPILTIAARQSPPDIDQIPFGDIDGYCLRLWVENEGKSRAEKVEVFVSEIRQRRPSDGEFIPVGSFIPMNLRWSFGSERPAHAEMFADGISPGMGVHCNLAR